MLHILVPGDQPVTVGQVVARLETREVAQPAAPAAPKESAAAPAAGKVFYPSVEKLLGETGLKPGQLQGTGPEGRLTQGDVLLAYESAPAAVPTSLPLSPSSREAPTSSAPLSHPSDEPVTRKPLSPIRKRIAERLLHAVQNTAMLTTFNEIDLGGVQELRSRYKGAFREKHGTSLGLTSFFVKAAVEALQAFPVLNASIDGNDLVFHDYWHIGVAVGSERGLVVPVIRHADRLGLPGVEHAIADFARKVKDNRLELSDLEGGTFTLTNGGVFGSLVSTPILNPPQCAILGLHKVEDRPVARDGQVVIRPMMYVALTYDHRLVDGRDAVRFLVRIKEEIEEPGRLLVEV